MSISALTITGAQIYSGFKNTLLDAINHAEGGPLASTPYGLKGVVTRGGMTYFPGRAAASALVDNFYDDWVGAGQPGDFLSYLQSRWAPLRAANDPTGLNPNWLPNVLDYLKAHGLSVAGGGGAGSAGSSPTPSGPGSSLALGPQSVKVLVYVAGAILIFYGLYGLATKRAARIEKVIPG